jgi:DNA-binding transcriptional LysR family regulator
MYPGIQAQLIRSDSGLDVIDDGLDVALRVGLPSDASVIAKKVMSTRRIVCASPAYLERHHCRIRIRLGMRSLSP